MLRTQKNFSPLNFDGLSFEKILSLLPKTRNSNLVSKILRPVFENKNIHKILGTNLAALTLFTGVTSIPVSALGVIPATGLYSNTIDVAVQTNKTVVYPLANPLGMSQRFHAFHPGVDLRA